jgi:hypothetical protein
MQLDLTDEEALALLNLLTETIENDRYPLSPRVQTLRGRDGGGPGDSARTARSVEAAYPPLRIMRLSGKERRTVTPSFRVLTIPH